MKKKKDSFSSFSDRADAFPERFQLRLGLYMLQLAEESNLFERLNKTYLWSFKHRSGFVLCWWVLFIYLFISNFHLFGNLPNLSQVFQVTSLLFNKHISYQRLCLISQFILKISETMRIVAYRTHTWGYVWIKRIHWHGSFSCMNEATS